MRIAFVGKGGSGKTTVSCLFALSLCGNEHQMQGAKPKPVALFDADINAHLHGLLGIDIPPSKKHLSHPRAAASIRKWLKGNNDITDIDAFRKTTPPTRKSNIVRISELHADSSPLSSFFTKITSMPNLSIFTVGTYEGADIGSGCYHNNLAILENILSHMDDSDGYAIADMVAGTDAFAGTLHSQFDLVCIVVEPTMRSIEVYRQYENLAKAAGVNDGVMVMGNKVRGKQDIDFISQNIPHDRLIGMLNDDAHIREHDQRGGSLDFSRIDDRNKEIFYHIQKVLAAKSADYPKLAKERLMRLHALHRKYISQPSIRSRFGDLSGQIDQDFTFTHDAHE